jgi:CRP/FNR family transcriptional regulator, anaerobic regulatory protein
MLLESERASLEQFCVLSEHGSKLLGQGAFTAECGRGDLVLHRGDRISGAYFVLRGRLRVYALAPDGTEATLYFVDPGETCVFALNSLFNDLRYPAWVSAEESTTVAVIPGPVFRQLFEREPAIQDVTVRALSGLVFRLMEELEEVHTYRLDQRLANLLLLNASADGEVRMTQQHIADHLGTTREVVARLMREFVSVGMVCTRRGIVTVLDAPALLAFLSGEGEKSNCAPLPHHREASRQAERVSS